MTTVAKTYLSVVFLLALLVGMPIDPVFAGTDIIVALGDDAPDDNGKFSYFGHPVLNASGQVAFQASFDDTLGGDIDSRGICIGSGGPITQVVRGGQPAPVGDGNFYGFEPPALNAAGQTVFMGTIDTAPFDGIFLASDGVPIKQVVREEQAAPDGDGKFIGFHPPVLGDSGKPAFFAGLGDTANMWGVFARSGPPLARLQQIARDGQSVPNGNGKYHGIGDPSINALGHVAFAASIKSSTAWPNDAGVFVKSGPSIKRIARSGENAPDFDGKYLTFGDPALGALGHAAFEATLTDTSADRDSGIFVGSGMLNAQIAREGQDAPGDVGKFSAFDPPAINASSQVAFRADLSDTAGGSDDNQGIFLGSLGPPMELVQIVRKGQLAPDGNGRFSELEVPQLNAAGQVVFEGRLTGTSGVLDDDRGIFLGNGIDLIQVAREGDTLAGNTIGRTSYTNTTVLRGEGRSGLNDDGQVCFRAAISGVGWVVARYTIPDVHWMDGRGGDWVTRGNWMEGTSPNSFHGTFINPTHGQVINGPTDPEIVGSLTIGAQTSGVSELVLQNDLSTLRGITVQDRGQLTMSGQTVDAGTRLTIEGLGKVAGHGMVHGDVSNQGEAIGDGTTMNERLVFGVDSRVDGNGTFINTLIEGTFAPGGSPGVVGGTNQAFGGTVEIELGGTTPGSGNNNHDQVNDTATILLTGSPELSILQWDGFIPSPGDEFVVMTWQDGLDGTFGPVTVDPLFQSNGITRFALTYNNPGGTGNLTLAAVPEPSTSILAVVGLLWLTMFARRRKK